MKNRTAVGKWKVKSLDDSSDKIIGFARFSIPSQDESYHYGAMFIDGRRNGRLDEYDRYREKNDERFPTSYTSVDRSKKMIDVVKGRAQIWFGTKMMIPYLPEYADGRYVIRIKDTKSDAYYEYNSYKSGFESTVNEFFGLDF